MSLLVATTPLSNLARWSAVRTAVANGTRRARLLCLGDSISAGFNSTANHMGSNARQYAYGTLMAPLFVSAPARADAFLADGYAPSDSDTLAQYDSRITQGSGWISDTTDTVTANGYLQEQGSATSSSLAFAPAATLDNLTVWYAKYSGSPQYTVNVDGGASLGTLPANAAAAIGVASFSVSSGTHTVNVASNGTAGGKIIGIETWNSASPAIQIMVAGADGWQASDWIQNNGNPWDPLKFVQALNPDLTIVCLGKNEQSLGVSQSAFQTNLTTLVQGILASGSPVVIFGPPVSNPANLGGMTEVAQLAYETNMATVATNLGCTFYSLTSSRASWGSYSAANTAGFMYTDGVHCTQAGYLDIAKALITVVG